MTSRSMVHICYDSFKAPKSSSNLWHPWLRQLKGLQYWSQKFDMTAKDRRPRQVIEDYPELGDWGGLRGSKSSSGTDLDDLKRQQPGLNGISPLNQSQYISRRLKLDLRNECEIPIAGKFDFIPTSAHLYL